MLLATQHQSPLLSHSQTGLWTPKKKLSKQPSAHCQVNSKAEAFSQRKGTVA